MIVDATKRLRSPWGVEIDPRTRRLIRHPSGATRICVAVTSSGTPAADRVSRYLHASRYPIATSASALMRPATKSGSKGSGRSGLTTCSTIGSVLPITSSPFARRALMSAIWSSSANSAPLADSSIMCTYCSSGPVPHTGRVPDAPDQPQLGAAAAYRLEQIGILDPDGVGPGPAAARHGRKEDRK